jgi:hypothetical protein
MSLCLIQDYQHIYKKWTAQALAKNIFNTLFNAQIT